MRINMNGPEINGFVEKDLPFILEEFCLSTTQYKSINTMFQDETGKLSKGPLTPFKFINHILCGNIKKSVGEWGNKAFLFTDMNKDILKNI